MHPEHVEAVVCSSQQKFIAAMNTGTPVRISTLLDAMALYVLTKDLFQHLSSAIDGHAAHRDLLDPKGVLRKPLKGHFDSMIQQLRKDGRWDDEQHYE